MGCVCGVVVDVVVDSCLVCIYGVVISVVLWVVEYISGGVVVCDSVVVSHGTVMILQHLNLSS